MSLRQKAINGLVWTSLEKWGGQALFFLTFVVLARTLSPANFGLISMANIFIHFVQGLLGQGFADAIVQRKELDEEHLDTAFWANLVIGISLCFLGLITAQLVANTFKQAELVPIIRWLSVSTILNGFSGTQQAILRRNLRFKSLAVRQLFGQLTGCIVAISMAFLGFGIWSLVSQQLISNLIGTLFLWKVSDWCPRFKFSWYHFKELFSFGINIIGTNILIYASLRSDDLLIAYYLGPVALGYYTVAYKLLVTITQLLIQSIRQIVLPTFSRLQTNPEKLRQAFYEATELLAFTAIPVFSGMCVVAPEVIVGLFGEQWEPSIPIMQILALVGLLRTVFNLSGNVIVATGKPSWNLGLMFLETLGKVVGFLIAVQWGVVAVAGSLLVTTYLFAPLRVWALRHLIQIDFGKYISRYFSPVLASLAMVSCILIVKYLAGNHLNIYILISLYISTGIVSYLCLIILLAPTLARKVLDILYAMIPSTIRNLF